MNLGEVRFVVLDPFGPRLSATEGGHQDGATDLPQNPRDLITFVTDRPGHDRRYAMDISKIEKDLGWTPAYNFETGLRQTVAWYLENRDWWQPLLSEEYNGYYENLYGASMASPMKSR